jgi:hypothetical protein
MTRPQGVVASASSLVPFGHLGWGYSDRAEFAARAAEYIADGLEQNQSIEYVGEGSRVALAAEFAAMPDIRDRLDRTMAPKWTRRWATERGPGS